MAKLTDDADHEARETFVNVPSPLSDAGNHDNYHGGRLRTTSSQPPQPVPPPHQLPTPTPLPPPPSPPTPAPFRPRIDLFPNEVTVRPMQYVRMECRVRNGYHPGTAMARPEIQLANGARMDTDPRFRVTRPSPDLLVVEIPLGLTEKDSVLYIKLAKCD
ncbi:unnamed protein product [Protopolystoma xenopodis]|uniref:Uncharacterized protein n=1 Tax=Protopolystoma xenopodis TaxID=117903 RepID=A0A3S5FCI9_9PLAT|nr:unnamed protein product [Protopolystoma xenopodis]